MICMVKCLGGVYLFCKFLNFEDTEGEDLEKMKKILLKMEEDRIFVM